MTSIAYHPAACTALLQHISGSGGRIDNAAPLSYTGAKPPDPWWLASALLDPQVEVDGSATWPSLQSL